jgi:hypothetical protein
MARPDVYNSLRWMDLQPENLAEGEGFEPPVRFPVQRFSRPPVSTTHTSLRDFASSVARLQGNA